MEFEKVHSSEIRGKIKAKYFDYAFWQILAHNK